MDPKTPDPVKLIKRVQKRVPAQEPPATLQQWRPLDQSLDQRLAQLRWRTQGPSAFTSDAVPHAIHNNGWVAPRVAELLFRSCEEHPPQGPFSVLEVGAGTGLFALQFVRRFRTLCAQRAAPFMEGFRYFVTDVSATVVERWARQKLFAEFEGCIEGGVVDASDIATATAQDGAKLGSKGLRTVVANYALDVLPSAFVRNTPDGPEEFGFETMIEPPLARVTARSPIPLAHLSTLAEADRLEGLEPILGLSDLLRYEGSFRPLKRPLPQLDARLAFGPESEPKLLNFGALSALESMVSAVDDAGFVVVNDVGIAASDAASVRFGGFRCYPLDFDFIDSRLKARDVESAGVRGAHRATETWLFGRTLDAGLKALLHDTFEDPRLLSAQRAPQEADAAIADHRPDVALEAYRALLAHNPDDWHALGRTADLLYQHFGLAAEALTLAERAVELNPWTCPALHNILGNARFGVGALDAAHRCYEDALALEDTNPQTWLNLSYTRAHLGKYRAALEAVGTALSLDARGQFTEALLAQQKGICQTLESEAKGERRALERRDAQLRLPRDAC